MTDASATARSSDPTILPGAQDVLTQAYRYLQRVIGVIALALPPVVYLGDRIIDGHKLRGSISSYYYGRTGGWFVGSLCALAVFFLSYDYRPRPGHDADNKLSNIASVTAIGVALFPTSEDGRRATGGSLRVAYVHLGCAAILFACLAVFSLYHFTRSDSVTGKGIAWRRIFSDPRKPELSDKKRLRNKIHRACGWLIVTALLAVPINNAFHWRLLFWCEAVAVWAFGISWLVKSHWISALNDPGPEAAATP